MWQEHEEGAYASLRDITAYFGEAFDEVDPARVLRIVRDFLGLYEKALAELEARPASDLGACHACPQTRCWGCRGQFPLALGGWWCLWAHMPRSHDAMRMCAGIQLAPTARVAGDACSPLRQ